MEQEAVPLNLNIYPPPLLLIDSHLLVRRKEEQLKSAQTRAVGSEQTVGIQLSFCAQSLTESCTLGLVIFVSSHLLFDNHSLMTEDLNA